MEAVPNALRRQQTPEQHELTRRRLQLSALRAALSAREQSLAALRAQLHSFEGRYIRQVGVLYRQLDEWERKIAELDSPLVLPEGLESEDSGTAESAKLLEAENETAAPPTITLDLKVLFRELAKRIHPDFASGSADAQRRTYLMAQANDAFRRKDAGMLQRMLHGEDAAAEPQDLAVELAAVLEQLARVYAATEAIEAETQSLRQSEMASLQESTLAAAESGRDLLAEMAARVKGSIGMAMRRYELDLVRRKRKEAKFDPTPFVSAETSGDRNPAPSSV